MTFLNFHSDCNFVFCEFYWNAAVVYYHWTNRFEHHTIATFFARWRHSATKLLNKKVITAFGIQYCRSSPTFTQFGRGVYKIFAIKHAGPVFGATLYMPLFLIVSEIYGRKVSKWWNILNFFELLAHPSCRNALADLYGSIPECAQVCALHIEPHLATMRQIEMIAVLCTNETPPIFWVFNSPSSRPRGRWTPQGERACRQTLSLHK